MQYFMDFVRGIIYEISIDRVPEKVYNNYVVFNCISIANAGAKCSFVLNHYPHRTKKTESAVNNMIPEQILDGNVPNVFGLLSMGALDQYIF